MQIRRESQHGFGGKWKYVVLGLWYDEVSRTGTSNYIPQYLRDLITFMR